MKKRTVNRADSKTQHQVLSESSRAQKVNGVVKGIIQLTRLINNDRRQKVSTSNNWHALKDDRFGMVIRKKRKKKRKTISLKNSLQSTIKRQLGTSNLDN